MRDSPIYVVVLEKGNYLELVIYTLQYGDTLIWHREIINQKNYFGLNKKMVLYKIEELGILK